MKKVRRIGVFETNSSSTHSVCIVSGPCDQTLQPESDGCIHVYPGEFGWKYQDYWDSETKASYAYTWCMNNVDGDNNKDAEELCPDPMIHKFTMLKEVIEEQTGSTVIFEKNLAAYYRFGYIDHQSWENEENCLQEAWSSKEKLKSFLFNQDSLLHTDHDNY